MKSIILTIFAVVFSSACAMNGSNKENINNWNDKDPTGTFKCIAPIKRSGSTALTNDRRKLAKIQLPSLYNLRDCVEALNYINSNYGDACNFNSSQIFTLREEISSEEGNDVYKYIVKQRFNDIVKCPPLIYATNDETICLLNEINSTTIDSYFNTDNLFVHNDIKEHFKRWRVMLSFVKQK